LSILGLLFVSVYPSFVFSSFENYKAVICMYTCVSDSISVLVLRALVCMMMSSCSIINISYEHTDDDKQKTKTLFFQSSRTSEFLCRLLEILSVVIFPKTRFREIGLKLKIVLKCEGEGILVIYLFWLYYFKRKIQYDKTRYKCFSLKYSFIYYITICFYLHSSILFLISTSIA
jgi:hypothetical protein